MASGKPSPIVSTSISRRQYKTPPITEALCAFHFSPDEEWNVISPALFYEKVKAAYGGKPREQKLINIEPNPKEAQGSAAMALNEITRVQFVTPDEKKILGIYQNHLSVSVTRPYPGWEVFRPTIEQGLSAYEEVCKPKGLTRIGLRYINQLEIDGRVTDILACFNSVPPSLVGANSHIENFTSRYEYLYEDEPIRVAIGFARVVAQAGKVSALLDIDLVWQSPGDVLLLKNAMAKVDDMRERERVIFESLITDRARQIFDA